MEENKMDSGIYQQLGQIQGELRGVITSITNFQNEVRQLTSDQNKRIEDLRKEMGDDLREIQSTIDQLDDGKLDKAEALRMKSEGDKIHDGLASKEDVALLKKIVYGACGLILVAFMGWLISSIK